MKTPRGTHNLAFGGGGTIGKPLPFVCFPGVSGGKEPICQHSRHMRPGIEPWVEKIPCRRKWRATLVFLPVDSHVQRAWWAMVHRVTKSWTQLKQLGMHIHAPSLCKVHIDSENIYTRHIWFMYVHWWLYFIQWKVCLSTEMDFPGDSDVEESACNVGDLSYIPGLGRSPGEGNCYPFQYSGLENSMDRWAWRPTVHGVAEIRT